MLNGLVSVLKEVVQEIKGLRKDLNEKIDTVNKRLEDIEEQNKKRFKKLHPEAKL